MTTGDHILYRTASRQRRRRGTVTETVPGWTHIKVRKNSEESWLARADVVEVLTKEPVKPIAKDQIKLL